MRLSIKDKKHFVQKTLLWLDILLLALIVRLPFLSHLAPDYTAFVEPWFRFFISEGYSVFKYDTFYYNVPYPYLVSVTATLLPNLPIIAIKSISIVFDFILAFFVYKCIRLKYPNSETVPILALLVVLFSPTVILNSVAWGQNDIIFITFIVACLYALLRGRQGWAFIAFGLAISFKLQAIFLTPFLLWLLLKKQIKWRYSLLVPLVYFIIILPAWFIGRPLDKLLLVYLNQANRYQELTAYAPNLYQWIDYRHEELYPAGIILSAYVVLALTLLVYKSRAKMTTSLLVQLAAFSALIVPFILPRMRDRYFILAEIIAIILAFYIPKYWFVPVIISLSNFMVHIRHLYKYKPMTMDELSILMLVAVIVLGLKLLRTLEYLPPPRSIFPARGENLRRGSRRGSERPAEMPPSGSTQGYRPRGYIRVLLSLTIGVMAFIAAAHLLMRTSYNGLLFDIDSVNYFSTAENLASGKGLRNYSDHSTSWWPPLYPLLLAFLNVLGMDVQDASRAINIVALGLIILLTGNWLRQHINSRLLVAGTVIIIVASPVMNLIPLFAMSETIFILLTLLALVQLDIFLNQGNSTIVLSLSALFAVLASLTRWVGISVILTTVILVMINQKISLRGRVRYTIFYGVLTIPFWVLVCREYISGYRTTSNVPYMDLFRYLRSVVELIYHDWLFVPVYGNIHSLTVSFEVVNFVEPEVSSSDKAVIFSGIVVLVIILITLISNIYRNRRENISKQRPVQYKTSSLLLLCITYTLLYLLTLPLILAASTVIGSYDAYPIPYRFFSPIYIPILLCIVLIFERFFCRNFGSIRPVFKIALVTLITLGSVAHINRITQWNADLTSKTLDYNNYNPYLEGYTLNSPIIEYLNNNRLEGDILTNYIDILYRLTDVIPPVRKIDCPKQLNQFTNLVPLPSPLKESGLSSTYIIQLTKIPNDENCSLQELSLRYSHLELIVETSDGLIYKIS